MKQLCSYCQFHEGLYFTLFALVFTIKCNWIKFKLKKPWLITESERFQTTCYRAYLSEQAVTSHVVDYVRMKVSKILGMFSRIRPSLTLETANRLYKAMVLPVLDYCDAVWHECGQGNSDKIERLQRRAARIVSFKAASKLTTDQIMTKLGLEPLYYRRQAHILKFVNECIANRVPRYLSNCFNVINRDIHRHKTRK